MSFENLGRGDISWERVNTDPAVRDKRRVQKDGTSIQGDIIPLGRRREGPRVQQILKVKI